MGRLINFCAGVNAHTMPLPRLEGILINVPYDGIDAKTINNTLRFLDLAKPTYCKLDSGGYQLSRYQSLGKAIDCDSNQPAELTKTRVNLAPRHVMEAAAAIRPTIVNSLDYPIGDRTRLNEEKEFIEKLGMNAGWAIQCAELKNSYCPDVQLFLPVQAYNLRQLELYFKMIAGVSFDGLGIPVRNFSLKELALFLVAFYRMRVRRVHILGSTEFFTIALGAYMATHLFEWVSLDATTWRIAAESSIYLNSHDLRPERILNVVVDESIQMDCPCPWCSNRTFTYISDLPKTERAAFLYCHNFWVIDRAFKELFANATTIDTLERYLRSKSRESEKIDRIIETLSLVQLLKDGDMETLSYALNIPGAYSLPWESGRTRSGGLGI